MTHDADGQMTRSSSISVTVENVGGIDHADIDISPGVTVLRGRNATNRTSFLTAMAGVLGGSSASLKSDAQSGSVVLEGNGQQYSRTFRREAESVIVGGDPYVSEESLVDTFVSMLEGNPARQAVERGEDLREIVMRPIDTDEIDERIASLRSEKERLTERIATVRERKDHLATLEDRRQSLESEIAAIDEEITSLREEIDEFEADQEMAAEAESLVEELDDVRQERNRVQNEIEVIEAEIQSIESEIESLEDAEPIEYTDAELEEVKEELAVARERRRQIEETINALFTIVGFNQDLIDGSLELPGIEPENAGPPTELAPEKDRELTCWTCGSRVTRQDVDERLDALRAVAEEKQSERAKIDRRVADLQDRRETIETALEKRDQLKQERAENRTLLEEKRTRLGTLKSRNEDLTDRIAALETNVAETQELRDDDLLDLYERLSDCQYERGQLEQQLADVSEEIETIQSLPAVAELKDEREEISERIADQRAHIDRLEARTVETFNTQMDELLDVLEYDNIARVWIEKRTHPDEPAGDGTFELHVIRDGSDGSGYEEHIDNLSESERELIGLVFGLAGYLSHEIYEDVPFVLLDSLEAMDSERIARLVDHFAEYTELLLVALLPEDARAVAPEYDRIAADALK